MSDHGAIVQSAVDIAKLSHLWDLACGKEQRVEKSLAEVRLEKGRILVDARKAFPARGPKAKGWGELLDKWKIEERTARNYMALAGYVESQEVSETVSETPTYIEAGIKNQKNEPPTPQVASADEETDPENYRTAFMLRADQAIKFAAGCESLIKEMQVSNELIAWVRRVADTWTKLAEKLEHGQ